MKTRAPVAKTLMLAALGLLVAVAITLLVEVATGSTVLLPGTPSGAGSGLVKGGVETPTPDSPTKASPSKSTVGPDGKVTSNGSATNQKPGNAAAAPASAGQGKDD